MLELSSNKTKLTFAALVQACHGRVRFSVIAIVKWLQSTFCYGFMYILCLITIGSHNDIKCIALQGLALSTTISCRVLPLPVDHDAPDKTPPPLRDFSSHSTSQVHNKIAGLRVLRTFSGFTTVELLSGPLSHTLVIAAVASLYYAPLALTGPDMCGGSSE